MELANSPYSGSGITRWQRPASCFHLPLLNIHTIIGSDGRLCPGGDRSCGTQARAYGNRFHALSPHSHHYILAGSLIKRTILFTNGMSCFDPFCLSLMPILQNDMDFQNTIATRINGVTINEPQPEVLSPVPEKIMFPRSHTHSTVRGRKSLASDRTDENSFLLSPPKTPLGIARTVRRTLSGGLLNILRPFQPSSTKVGACPPPGFRLLKP